jgi:tRNA A-37 threonylcarbamoyl transferase component Bud32
VSAVRLIIADRFRDEVEELSLREPGGIERWLATGTPVEGGRGGSLRVELPRSRTPVHLRPLQHGGWLRAATQRRFLGTARSAAELEITAKLRAAGAPVADPVLVFARRRGLFWHVDVGTCFVEPSASFGRLLTTADPSRRVDAAHAAGHAVRNFHDAGGSHRDLHTGNLLVATGAVTVIDLDGARCLEHVSPARRMRELMRFERSLRKHHADQSNLEGIRTAFFEGYTRGDAKLHEQLAARETCERLRNSLHALAWRG